MFVVFYELKKIKKQIESYGEEFVKNYITELYKEGRILEFKTCIKILYAIGLDNYIPKEKDLVSNTQEISPIQVYSNSESPKKIKLESKFAEVRKILDKNNIRWYI